MKIEFGELTSRELTEIYDGVKAEFERRWDAAKTTLQEFNLADPSLTRTTTLSALPARTQEIVRMASPRLDDSTRITCQYPFEEPPLMRRRAGFCLSWSPSNREEIGGLTLIPKLSTGTGGYNGRIIFVDTLKNGYSVNPSDSDFNIKGTEEYRQGIRAMHAWGLDGNQHQQLEVITELIDFLRGH